jgi:hypothetical protein
MCITRVPTSMTTHERTHALTSAARAHAEPNTHSTQTSAHTHGVDAGRAPRASAQWLLAGHKRCKPRAMTFFLQMKSDTDEIGCARVCSTIHLVTLSSACESAPTINVRGSAASCSPRSCARAGRCATRGAPVRHCCAAEAARAGWPHARSAGRRRSACSLTWCACPPPAQHRQSMSASLHTMAGLPARIVNARVHRLEFFGAVQY